LSDTKYILVYGERFDALTPRARRAQAERMATAALGPAKPSLWRRIVRWLKG
jgi:hypothetical protein